ncbi:hypothetical protein JCM24511_04241 [Saitozyma sp. JCM 24511]|nr:hypothetical protein JCM24511_04241 [Saitozyma sp. JCM 24511]
MTSSALVRAAFQSMVVDKGWSPANVEGDVGWKGDWEKKDVAKEARSSVVVVVLPDAVWPYAITRLCCTTEMKHMW